MKYFIPLLLMAVSVKAQSIMTNTTDKATGNRTIITKNFSGSELGPADTVMKSGLVFFSAGYNELKTGNRSTDLYFIQLNIIHNDSRIGCLKDGKSKIVLILADGTQMECTQISDSDCDTIGLSGAFALMPKGGTQQQMKENFEKLQNVEIKKIDVYTTERMIDYSVKNDLKSYLKRHFRLLKLTVDKKES